MSVKYTDGAKAFLWMICALTMALILYIIFLFKPTSPASPVFLGETPPVLISCKENNYLQTIPEGKIDITLKVLTPESLDRRTICLVRKEPDSWAVYFENSKAG
ncbi:hypothetical protein I6L58_18545 [Enterobacter cancerogenus]|jgi:hypothetical protein|uniref:Uncharacterized protein n=1 Tax=Enterobacter cancerogenus TaxID=69218 RepID=A0ABX8KIA6_9ENTR|nr:hypothetical protein [Enterobacter cancerogenus]QXA48685.1 hypothetical protein I6L58_18545 [Enterobacter cancerogenus]